MKLIKQILTALAALTLIVASIGMASSSAQAASPFTCGQTSLDLDASLPGTVSCEAGEDYIRWTFSGLAPRSVSFGYDYIAAQAGWAEMQVNVEYTKKMWDADVGANKGWSHNYIWYQYGDVVSGGNYDHMTNVQIIGPGDGAGVDNDAPYAVGWRQTYTAADNTTRLLENFKPGSGKSFVIYRHDQSVGAPPEDQMSGSAEIRLVEQGQSSLVSTSPFYCGGLWGGGGYRSDDPSSEVSF